MLKQSAVTILTLDAGGTNFVFSAIRDFKEISEPITLPANADHLDRCLSTIIAGFEQLASAVGNFDAISFAFPGPANYQLGIIGDLPNFKAFNGDVPLGPILKHHFKVPVLINNDGNLFAFGVALAGYLPGLNSRLLEAGSEKRFHNLIGITLGTGFGCGIVSNGHLITGDNSSGAEIHNTLNPINPKWNAEESVSTRAIQRVYAEQAGIPFSNKLMPKDIYDIAKGNAEGNVKAATEAFSQYGRALGGSIVNVLTLIDGIVVIGGGLSGSWDLFEASMFAEINKSIENFKGEKKNRLSYKVFNLEDLSTFDEFARGEIREIAVQGTDEVIRYDCLPRSGVALSQLGGSRATSLGAYALALKHLENIEHE
ncbi:MAG: ROK family protein [Cyclobacteriaceae bacterium]